MGLIFLITILLIVYGSLYPFDFHAGRVAQGPVWMLLHGGPATINRFVIRDIAINIFIYLPLGLFGALWLGKGKPRFATSVLTILLALTLSVSMELLQFFDGSRETSSLDVATNGAGVILGVFLAYFYGRTSMRIMARPGMRAALHPSGAMLLVFCWLAYQIYPFFPQSGLYMVHAKLAVLIHNLALPGAPAIGAVVDWLAMAQLLEVIAGPEFGFLLLPLSMLLMPARLLIVGRSFTSDEIAGAVCAWALWSAWLHRSEKRTVLLAWLAAGMLLVRGLAPYRWTHLVNPFCWMPFQGFLESDWGSAGLVLLNKTFLYGTAVWLFHKAGYSFIRSTLGLAALLAAIEAVQMYLPGRSSEITDPILVIVLAVVLKSLDSTDRLAVSRVEAVNRSGSGA